MSRTVKYNRVADVIAVIVSVILIWGGASSLHDNGVGSTFDKGSWITGVLVLVFAGMIFGVAVNKIAQTLRTSPKRGAKESK